MNQNYTRIIQKCLIEILKTYQTKSHQHRRIWLVQSLETMKTTFDLAPI